MIQRPANVDVYFLGGHDLEMLTIRELLKSYRQLICDAELSWGARASVYSEQLAIEAAQGRILVLVELILDIQLPATAAVVVIDHHGQQAGREQPTALEQVAMRLGISPDDFAKNRWWQLVAANDRGHVRAMRALQPPATDDEVRRVRHLDLAAQGVSEAEFKQARELAARSESCAGGRLTVARCPGNRTGLVAEVMEPFFGGPGFENLLVLGETEIGFYGAGRLIAALAARSPPPPAAWFGGSLPEFGFWGAVQAALAFEPSVLLAAELERDSKFD